MTTPGGEDSAQAARRSRVTIITPDTPMLQHHATTTTVDKRAQIRRDRRTTAHKPEYMSALRRTRLHLGSNEQVRQIILRVEQPLPLRTAGAREALCRRLPWLSSGRQDDEDAYHAACHRPVKLLTTDVSGGSWYCERIDPKKSGEPCHVVNEPSRQTCHLCGATRYCPNLRPFYSRLARLRSAVHKEIRIKSTRIVEVNGELEALEEALSMAQERLAELQRFVADSPAGPGGSEANSDDAPESLRMLDIDITQSGSWQRMDVRTLVPDIIARQHRTHRLLAEIRGELSIVVQVLYETAAPIVQKVVRGHLLRCRFDSIRQAIIHMAETEAGTEIQRMIRSYLAKAETERRRLERREAMRLRLQTIARHFLACQEYNRRHTAYVQNFRHDMALRIQRLARIWRARSVLDAMAVEKRCRIAQAESRREAAAKDASAIRIQSIARIWLAMRVASQKRIELTLSSRLLHLLEKLKYDGNIHSMLSEINADYRYYDREMKRIVAREDQTASTFIAKVIKERRKEFDDAWRDFRNTNANIKGKKENKDSLDKEGNTLIDRFHMYGPARSESPPSDEHLARFVDPLGDGDQGPHKDWEFDRMEEMDLAGLSHTSSHRFSGTSILCDIPQLLDDSLARLINAVAIRSFVPQSVSKQTELSSSSTDAFQYYLNLPPGLEKANIEAEAKSLAKPIIEQLHRMGFVYITDVMPRGNLLSLLESLSIATPPSSTFISCCNDIMTFLQRAHDVNVSTRGTVRALVSEFIESRQGITMRVEQNSAGGEERDCKGRMADDESLPSGLFYETSSNIHVDQSTADDSDECENMDPSDNDSSTPVSPPAITRAQHDFEAELDGIVSFAIADTQHRSGKCKRESSKSSHIEVSSKICTTGGGKQSHFVGFKGGLFRQTKTRKANCSQSNRPRCSRNSTTDSSKCWAVPYIESVRQTHSKYVKYRSQKSLLDCRTYVDGTFSLLVEKKENDPRTNMPSLLDGLPDEMQVALKTMVEKKRNESVPSLLT